MKNRNWRSLGDYAALPAFLMHPCAEGEGGDGGGGGDAGGDKGGGGGDKGGGGGGDIFSTLSDENKAYQSTKNYKPDINEVFNALRSAESYVGLDKAQLLKLPADRSPEKMGDVFTALGKPKDIAGYEIKPNAEIGLDGQPLESFLKTAHEKAHLLPWQVKALVDDWYAPMTKSLGEAKTAQQEQAFKDGDAAIREAFGAAYDDKIKGINALLEQHGDEKLDAYMLESGKGNDPAFVFFLDKIAKLVGEGGLPGEGGRDLSGGKLSPAEATAKLAEFERVNIDALRSKSHPDHAALVKQREDLIKAAYPG